MASWEDLATYIRSEYRILEDTPDEMRIFKRYDDGRSQVIIVRREVLDRREDWVQLAAVCGPVDAVDLPALLRELGETTVVCGAVVLDEHVVLRHSLPLENLDINEFTDPMTFIADTADELEQKFVGGDGY